MKNSDLAKKIFFSFLVKIGIWTFSFPLFLWIMLIIINFADFQWVFDLSPRIYNLGIAALNTMDRGWFWLIIIIIWAFGLIIILYKLVTKIFSYVDAISKASESLMNKDVEYIELPSELENLQIKMNHLKREAEKNERLALESEQKKNDLIVYLAHDLKTPLTSMIGYLSLIDEIKDMPKNQREKYVSVALDKSYRLEDLINELFDIARFNSEKIVLEKEEVNLGLMLEQVIDDFYPLLNEKDKKIELHSKAKVILEADSDKLARVFGNLIKNAINYSDDSLITIDVEVVGESVKIITTNKGKKISKEKLNKIFEKFYRADSSRATRTGGTGLGLAIAKEIVELHDGKISATSDDRYTKFYIELPIKKS